MKKCIKCGSHAFNLYAEEIDQGGFCDVHYWQGRAHRAEALAQPEPPPECKTEEEKTAFAFGWWKALETQSRNFCPRCGKRLFGMAFAAGGIHTCTPPQPINWVDHEPT